ncbi:MAG: hypothetical protein J6K22_08695 [Spirochaetaceae bacterium]|nr:hypothetical protein [Spirochaetaceae bacterium]
MKLRNFLVLFVVFAVSLIFVGCGGTDLYDLTDWESTETQTIEIEGFLIPVTIRTHLSFTNHDFYFSRTVGNIEYDYHESESYNVLYWIEKIPNLNVRILDNGKVIEDTAIAEIDGDVLNFTFYGKTYKLTRAQY